MYSAAFLKKYAQVRKQNAQKQKPVAPSLATPEAEDKKRVIGTAPPPWANRTQGDIKAIVYDPLTGKAYPNPSTARSEGVTKFIYNIPSGMNIDWSYWNRFKQPEPAPVEVQELTVADQTVAMPKKATYNPPPAPKPPPVVQTAAPPVVQTVAPPVVQTVAQPEPKPSPGPAKSFASWNKRAKELGWKPEESGRASYEGYLNNLRAMGRPGIEPKA